MNKQHPEALKKHWVWFWSDRWGQCVWLLDGAGAPPTSAAIMMCGLSEKHRQITFRTTKLFSLRKTITGIQQLQIALKFPSLFLWIINESQTKKEGGGKTTKGGGQRRMLSSCNYAREWRDGTKLLKSETETKSWKFRAQGWKEKHFLFQMQSQSCVEAKTIRLESVSVTSVLEWTTSGQYVHVHKCQKTEEKKQLESGNVPWAEATIFNIFEQEKFKSNSWFYRNLCKRTPYLFNRTPADEAQRFYKTEITLCGMWTYLNYLVFCVNLL